MKHNKTFWELYAWIIRGSQRKRIIRELGEKPVTTEEFRKKFNSKFSSDMQLSLREMSRHFTSFYKRGILDCLTPKVPYGKLYIITDIGKKIQKEIINEQ